MASLTLPIIQKATTRSLASHSGRNAPACLARLNRRSNCGPPRWWKAATLSIPWVAEITWRIPRSLACSSQMRYRQASNASRGSAIASHSRRTAMNWPVFSFRHSLDQRLLAREVPVGGRYPDAGVARDLFQGHVGAPLGEQRLGRPHEQAAVAGHVLADRLVDGSHPQTPLPAAEALRREEPTAVMSAL